LKVRLLSLPLAAALTVALAPGASAATLAFDRSCYRPLQTAALSGAGYTPNGPVAIGRDGRYIGALRATPAGAIFGEVDPPDRLGGEQRLTYAAVDATNTALNAATQITTTALDVTVRPTGGSPSRPRRIGARGFIGGRTLYAHVRRGRYRLRVRVGRLRGACAKVTARRRLLRRGTGPGTYRVQFDARRRYSRCRGVTARRACVVYRITVFRTFGASASASASGLAERWDRVR